MKYSRFAPNSGDATSIRLSITAMREDYTRARVPACITPTTSSGMAKIFECVPNVSEGRRADVIESIRAAASGPDVAVVDVSSDASHNRSVITLVGTGDGVVAAAIRLAGAAIEHIDLRNHS